MLLLGAHYTLVFAYLIFFSNIRIVWMNFRVEQKFGVTHTLEARQTWTVGTKHKRFSKTQVRPNRQRFSTNLYFLLFSMKLFVYFTFFHTLRY